MSSYKAINESWHRFLTEVSAQEEEEDTAPEPEPGPEISPAAAENDEDPEGSRTVFGINSDKKINPDSLKSMLEPLDFIDKDQKGQLLLVMLKAAEEDDVVLEAIGGPDRDPRTFSPNTTRELNAVVASFHLIPSKLQKLEKTIKMWAKLNTVKFSAPPKDPDTDIELPPEAPVSIDDEPAPEPSATATPSKDKMSLWQRLDNARNLAEYGEVYEKIRKILNPDGNTWEEIMGELQSGGPEHASTAISAFGEDRDENNRSHHQIKFIELATAHQQDQFDNPPDEEEDTSDEPTESDETKESKVLSIIGSSLDAISAAGVFPPAEATLIPTGATLASLGLNLYQKKIGWALLDLIALVPWAGKFAKAGSLGKIAKTVAATGKTGKALATATKAMKLADPAFKATKLAKGVAGVKELYEHVPEEYIRTAVYAKTDDGKGKKYYIDFVLEVLGHIPHPIIKAGVEALKEAVVWVRKDLGGPPKDEPEKEPEGWGEYTGRENLQEQLDRWQTIAGINKRIL